MITPEQAQVFAQMMSGPATPTTNVDPDRQYILVDGKGEPLFSCLGTASDAEWLNEVLESKKLNIRIVKKDPNYVPKAKVRAS